MNKIVGCYNKDMIKAVVFDCFGVVISDALSVLCDGLAETAPDKVKEIRSLIQAANRGIMDTNITTPRVAELLGMSVDEYRKTLNAGEARDVRLLNFIKTLRPDYKTAMLSNITKQGLDRRFPGKELGEYFDEVVISSEIGFAKPDPEPYHIVADRLGVSPEQCVFTDDRLNYCQAAEEVGMKAIVYTSFAQFYHEFTEVIAAQ